MPGSDVGVLKRLLALAAGFPRASLAVHQSDETRLRAEVATLEAKADLIVVPDGVELWTWVQDRFVVCRHPGGSGNWIVDSGLDESDGTAAAAARADARLERASAGLPIDGGNILADEETCFVGGDLCGDDMDKFKWHFSGAVEGRRSIQVVACDTPIPRRGPERFEIAPGDLTWRQDIDRCIAVDGARQPAFHLDLFMTLIGRRRVLLGDPAWASKITGIALPDGYPLRAFAEIDKVLRCSGFEVIRNPLPFVYFDEPQARIREWFYASANNCWVECLDGPGSRAWLPEYGFGAWPELKATDAINAAIWRDLGFEVVRCGDFLPLADRLGSLNCVSKVLARG